MSSPSSSLLDIRPLSAGLQEIAVRNLNEEPNRIANDIAALREWIEKLPHLRSRSDPQFLVAFLRGSKYSLEKAKLKIDRFYTLQKCIPEVFRNKSVDDEKVLNIIRMGVIIRIPLPEGDCGPCITIIRPTVYDPSEYKFSEIINVGMMFGEIMMLEDDNSTVCGYVEIMDMINANASHMLHLPPTLVRKLAMFADEAMPMRQRGTHFINVSQHFVTGFNRLKGIFAKKALDRITVSSNSSDIYEIVPRKLFPVEYGGENGTIAEIIAAMETKLLSYREHFLDGNNYGTDEQLREENIDQFNGDNILFGMSGSFRRMTID